MESQKDPLSTEANNIQSPNPEPWIRYRIEYRDSTTDQVLRSLESRDARELHSLSSTGPGFEWPPFEEVKTYRIKPWTNQNSDQGTSLPAPTGAVVPVRCVRILSPAIINALQAVVKYYPGQDLTGDVVEVRWPYPVLAHHYDELAEFAKKCEGQKKELLCEREYDAASHIKLLLKYLDESVMDLVRAEQERNRKGFYTFEGYWVGSKPGTTILQSIREDRNLRRLVVHSVRGGTFTYPPQDWEVNYWAMEFDGTYLGRVMVEIGPAKKFDGEKVLNKNGLLLLGFGDQINCSGENKEIAEDLIRQGMIYWSLLKKQCKYYAGKSQQFPYNKIEGHVMVDLEGYYEGPLSTARPDQMKDDDCRNWLSDCQCAVCRSRKKAAGEPLFMSYNNITPVQWDELTPHQYLLCPFEIPAFVFRTRTWEKLHVSHFSEAKFDNRMIDHLVMDPARLRTLKALAKSFARLNVNEERMIEGQWSADFVRGKGNGLIFLLHGKPGVGKTCTAECIAEFTQRPLMVLTSSDIGTDPSQVEINLTTQFKRAKSWGAVLLIDEADIFMQERDSRDLERNGLVAGFLRALEFFDGILFLTTNRVGVFDDAFMSRVHVKLYYANFNDEQRAQIWQTFVDKLARERSKDMRLNMDAKEYLKSKAVKAMKWNGREIRNAFQTAVALAEYDAVKDDEGRIVVTDNHLRAVVELSKDFQDYLDRLHKGDESKRAERKGERLDSFVGNSQGY